jgi:2-polyprenyl-3-methyl-5-hydroxy-6-metoxy-1,4-benzoquinol methylase
MLESQAGEPMMMQRWFFELRYLFRRTPWDTGITPPEVVAFLDRTPPGRALDLGGGTGTNAVEMARRGWEVTAIDFSSRAVLAARRRAAPPPGSPSPSSRAM